jgi:nicotinamidase-related amidase
MLQISDLSKVVLSVMVSTLIHTSAVAQEVKNMTTSAVKKTALVVVDAQVGILGSVWESTRIVGNIEALVGKARTAGVPVVWVQHSDEELKYGSKEWQLLPNFKVQSSDTVIHKKFNSAFADTELEKKLSEAGVKRIALAGALTNWCVRATAYSAIERGFDLAIASDAHSTENLETAPSKFIAAGDIVAEFNSVMRWLSVPKLRIEVQGAGELAF